MKALILLLCLVSLQEQEDLPTGAFGRPALGGPVFGDGLSDGLVAVAGNQRASHRSHL